MDENLYNKFKDAPKWYGKPEYKYRYCMMKYDGTVDYYLDPKNPYLKEDGTPSDVNNPDYEGNVMMEFGFDK